jgi:DNA-directed RNA polymerase specialized sigma24 family protein
MSIRIAAQAYLMKPASPDKLLAEVIQLATARARRADRRLSAEDIAQDAALSLWEQLAGFEGDADGLARLTHATITRRIADAQRRLYRRPEDQLDLGHEEEDMEAHYEPRSGYAEVLAAAASLGKTVVDLLLQGYSVAETASLTGQSAPCLRSKIVRARETAAANKLSSPERYRE